MFKLPSLDKLASDLASFPPKVSSLTELLTEPENLFEQQASSLGIPVPPGPAKMATQMLQNLESVTVSPALPFPLPSFQFEVPQTQAVVPPKTESLGEAEMVEVSKPAVSPRVQVEILEA